MKASYATAEQARSYVAAVLARPRPEGRPARVYLIMRPQLRSFADRWAKLERALQANVYGAELVDYRAVFGKRQPPVAERVAFILERCDAALVVPHAAHWSGLPTRYLIGASARAEAEQLTAAGFPVLVFSPNGLLAWPDILARPAGAPVPPPHLSQEIVMPERRAGTLPTVAASLRAIGIDPDRPIPGRARKPAPPQRPRPRPPRR